MRTAFELKAMLEDLSCQTDRPDGIVAIAQRRFLITALQSLAPLNWRKALEVGQCYNMEMLVERFIFMQVLCHGLVGLVNRPVVLAGSQPC
jgi:hypothetical protein